MILDFVIVISLLIAILGVVFGLASVLMAFYRAIGASGCLLVSFFGLVAMIWVIIAMAPGIKLVQ